MSRKIAVVGNPNCGKTTLFNLITGSNQYVGNWPGVTVEKKEGRLKGDSQIKIADLPGVYSLSPYTLEEVITRDYLIDEDPDIILNVLDSTNLERNLYLTTQLLDLGKPMIVALNMMDALEKQNKELDSKHLAKRLGCKVVEISALQGTGMEELMDLLKNGNIKPCKKTTEFSGKTEHALAHIEEAILHDFEENYQRYYSIKLFERDEKIAKRLNLSKEDLDHIEQDILWCEGELDDDSESIIVSDRYDYVAKLIKNIYKGQESLKPTISERIDSIVTNRYLALPIFAGVMFIVYFVSVTTVGAWVTDFTNDVIFGQAVPNAIEHFLVSVNAAPWLMSLILDGIVAGVGAVLGFVPQLLILFSFLAFLEGCGYMSRVAFIMDKIFRKFGLSGKSFIPMLIGTGCGVPGIMASRTIESERDRRMTIMTTTFMPCSAKLPIIALIAGALFDGAWWVAPTAYFLGIFAIVVSGLILKRTKMFSGNPAPFVMELPDYHMPTATNIFRSVWERGWSFVKKAGTIILLSSMVIWFFTNYGIVDGKIVMVEDFSQGMLASLGMLIAPIFIPLGFGNWQSSVATLTGLVAKENVVGTFGVLYGFSEVSESGVQIWQALANSFTPASGLSFLVFNLLCAPCFAAIGAIRREMNSAKWTWFAIIYQTVFAYAVAFIVYQVGSLIM